MSCADDSIAYIARFKLTRINYHFVDRLTQDYEATVSYLHQTVAHGFHGIDIEQVDNYGSGLDHDGYT